MQIIPKIGIYIIYTLKVCKWQDGQLEVDNLNVLQTNDTFQHHYTFRFLSWYSDTYAKIFDHLKYASQIINAHTFGIWSSTVIAVFWKYCVKWSIGVNFTNGLKLSQPSFCIRFKPPNRLKSVRVIGPWLYFMNFKALIYVIVYAFDYWFICSLVAIFGRPNDTLNLLASKILWFELNLLYDIGSTGILKVQLETEE